MWWYFVLIKWFPPIVIVLSFIGGAYAAWDLIHNND